MNEWLTSEEIAELEGITPRSARRRYLALARGRNGTSEFFFRQVSAKGGPNGVRFEFRIDLLPDHLRAQALAIINERQAQDARLKPAATQEDSRTSPQQPASMKLGERPPQNWRAGTRGDRSGDGRANGSIALARTGRTSVPAAPLYKDGLPARRPREALSLLSSSPNLPSTTGSSVSHTPSPAQALCRTSDSVSLAGHEQCSLLIPPEAERELAGLNQRQVEAALEAYRSIEPVLSGAIDRGPFKDRAQAIEWLAKQHETSASTLWRRLRAYREAQGRGESGWRALAPKPNRSKGISRTLSPEDCLFVRREFLRDPNRRAAWLALREDYRLRGAALDHLRSYSAVRRFLRSEVSEAERSRAHDGAKRFSERHLPFIRRRWDDLEPNDLWVLDHSQFDVAVDAWGHAVFPWLTAIMDGAARYLVGVVLSLQPNRHTIASALRMGVRRFGRPKAGYIDRGRDYRSRYLEGRRVVLSGNFGVEFPQEAGAVFQDLSIGLEGPDPDNPGQTRLRKVIKALPYHAQSKPIERFFRTVRQQFDQEFSSYRGRNTVTRYEAADALLEAHKDNPQASPLPSLPLFAMAFFAWLEQRYHQAPHTGQGMNNRTPQEVYRPSERLPFDEPTLDLLLLERTTRVIQRCEVRMFNTFYQSPDLLHHNGHTAEVAFDPLGYLFADLSEIIITCCGQRFLVRATPLLSMKNVDYPELQRRLKERAQLKKQLERGIAAEIQLSTPSWMRWADQMKPEDLPEEFLRPCLPAAREALGEQKTRVHRAEYTNESAAALARLLDSPEENS